jgi:hypothetical protein
MSDKTKTEIDQAYSDFVSMHLELIEHFVTGGREHGPDQVQAMIQRSCFMPDSPFDPRTVMLAMVAKIVGYVEMIEESTPATPGGN